MEPLTDQNWLLTVGTFLPMLGVLVMMFIPRSEEATHKLIGVVTAGATLAIGVVTLFAFDYGQSERLQFYVNAEWIPVINSNYTVGLDGISLPLYFLSMAVTFLVMIYTWTNMPDAGNPKAFYILMLILQTGMAGTFIAQDLTGLAGRHAIGQLRDGHHSHGAAVGEHERQPLGRVGGVQRQVSAAGAQDREDRRR
jgi:NADH-quinone oxidoreductase subunit M